MRGDESTGEGDGEGDGDNVSSLTYGSIVVFCCDGVPVTDGDISSSGQCPLTLPVATIQ